MSEMLAGIPPLNIGVAGLLTLVFLLMLTGKIPTLRELRDSQAREQRAMELAEKWQKVATEHGMTLLRIVEGLETANYALTEIQTAVTPHGERES